MSTRKITESEMLQPLKPSQLHELLVFSLSACKSGIPGGFPILVKGRPGVGKTDIAKQAAATVDADIIIRHPVVDSPVDYKGMPIVVDGAAVFSPFGDQRQILEATKLTLVMLDDMGQAPPATQAAAMQMLLERKLNEQVVPDCVVFVACTNRKEDLAGVSGILEPVKSRFDTIVELETDLNDWCKWALKNDLPSECIAFIRFRPNFLVDFKPTPDITNSPCPRTVSKAFRMYQQGIPGGIEFTVLGGAGGPGFASEFMGFVKIHRSLPNPDVVLMDPENYKVPTDPATLYALSGALAARANEENAGRFFKAIGRLPQEFSITAVRDAFSRNEDLANVREFTEWVTNNQEVLL